ncbi:peptide ABC transporter permease [Clostridium zeae]|uniref:Peptide ABC transporter permease n=1 Tax=Clostridium zeae TaxID=2759022 RepID=A0ABQ1EGH8_9CLOT|nr:oligopeptide ABC transporter permease [Clostridium zeae]GFZ33786.1 peptide ABC transporter permease [Clostridium zeae]
MSKEKVETSENAWKRFRNDKLALFGLIVLVVFIVLAIIAPIIAPYGRDTIDMINIEASPSKVHILGTDELGRDVFTRLIYGGQISLSVGVVATTIQLAIGIILGSIAGYCGGVVDTIIMRLVDIIMCFPFFVIAISMAAILGPSIWNVMIIIGVLQWTNLARIVRAEILSLKRREFIEAAKALGLDGKDIIIKHLLPNIFAPIIVYATLGIAGGILSEAGLSFLGMGVKQPQPSWGNMLSAAQKMTILQSEWWLWIPPGLMVFLTVLSINFLGDGIRDALDPKLRR